MKKLLFIFVAIATTAIVFSSCSKYEEGPKISLLTKKARLTGDWTLKSVSENGTEISVPSGVTYKMTIKKDGSGFTTINSISFSFKWEFANKKQDLRVKTDGDDVWVESEIIKLKNKELWIKDTEDGVSTIMKFEQ